MVLRQFLSPIPWPTVLKILIVWASLAVANGLLRWLEFETGGPKWFPISVFRGPEVHWRGLPYAGLFVILLIWGIGSVGRGGWMRWTLIGSVLIISGNLAQGGFHEAFHKPFLESDLQYYHDALEITSGQNWLASFNDLQSTLHDHSRTHPPFTVLLHYILLYRTATPTVVATVFTLLALACTPLVYAVCRTIGCGAIRSTALMGLWGVLPATNIYSVVCLDAVIATTSTLFILGIARIVRRPLDLAGVLLVTAGLVFTNLLTFGGVFLFGVAGIHSCWQIMTKRASPVLIPLMIATTVFLAVIVILSIAFGYNHWQAFTLAVSLENPDGFRILHDPLGYAVTRIENVAEILLFFSVVGTAVVASRINVTGIISELRDPGGVLAVAGMVCLLSLFLVGAYRTGETARACLFIYPYLLLLLHRVPLRVIRAVFIFGGVQTILMQTFGGYVW